MSQFMENIAIISVRFIVDQIGVLVSLQDAEVLLVIGTEFNLSESPVTRGVHGICKAVFEDKCWHVDFMYFAFRCFKETNLWL